MLTPLRLHESPIDSHNSLALEPFQRFRKRQKTRPSFLVETDFAEVCPALRRSHRHDAIIFQERLEALIGLRLLPERVNFRPAGFFDHLRKAYGFHLEQFHKTAAKEYPSAL